jgi:hypothetical protein
MKFKTICIIAALIIISMPMTTHAQCKSVGNLYPKTAVITAINQQTGKVDLFDGYYTWSFVGAEDWQVGDTVSMIMDGKGTKSVNDDTIVSMRASSLELVG